MSVVRRHSVRVALAVLPMALVVALGSAGLAQATEKDSPATVHKGNVDGGHPDNCVTDDWWISHWFACDVPPHKTMPTKSMPTKNMPGGHTTKTTPTKNTPTKNTPTKNTPTKNTPTKPGGDTTTPTKPGGDMTTTTSTKPTTSKTSSSSPTESTSRTPGESSSAPGTTSTAGGNVTTTTTPGAVVIENSSDSGDLAATGFASSWLVWAGGLLVLAGAAVLVLLRIRRNA